MNPIVRSDVLLLHKRQQNVASKQKAEHEKLGIPDHECQRLNEGVIQMQRSINEISETKLKALLKALSHAGARVEDAIWLTQDQNAFKIVHFIREQQELEKVNPFQQTVEEQLAALRRQNELGNWGIDESVFARLAETAPEWPKGRDAYRSFRIRFGEGREGMIKTAEAHAAAIEHVHDKYWRWKLLLSGEHPYQGKPLDRLRLLAGNDSHHAVVEWIIIPNLQQHRQRDCITSVRDHKSLADEGLVLTWLVPDRVHAIDYEEWCAWVCAGYELNSPEDDIFPWQSVLNVHLDLNDGTTGLGTLWNCFDKSPFSVPSLG